MPKLEPGTIIPTPKEDAAINAGIAADPDADPDNPEWMGKDFRRALPFAGLPASRLAKLRGRPKAEVTKERITIRLSPDVLQRFRKSGRGWRTRMDAALREWLMTHPRRTG